MEYLEKALKKTGYISIIESIIFLIIGAVLFWKAEFAIKIISYILGGIFIAVGLVNVIKYVVVSKDYFENYNYELIYGLMAIVIGIITICYSSTIETILRIIIGVWIIYSSFVKFNLAMRIKAIGSSAWIYSTVISIIMFVCGLYVILNAGTIIATIGLSIMIYSVLDIIEDIICIANIKEEIF